MRLALALCLFASLPLAAQDNKLVKTLSTHWTTTKTYTLAVAEQMPEDQYSFKPTDAQMTFAGQMMHIAESNTYFFGKMSGAKPPSIGDPKTTTSKAAVLAALKTSFEFAGAQLDKATDAQMMNMVDTGDGKMTMMEGVLLAFEPHGPPPRANSGVFTLEGDCADGIQVLIWTGFGHLGYASRNTRAAPVRRLALVV